MDSFESLLECHVKKIAKFIPELDEKCMLVVLCLSDSTNMSKLINS